MFSTSDQVRMLKATGGKLVEHNGAQTYGHLDTFAQDFDPSQGGARIAGVDRRLVFVTGELPDLAQDEVVVIDGLDYEVLDPPRPVEDGGLTATRVRPA